MKSQRSAFFVVLLFLSKSINLLEWTQAFPLQPRCRSTVVGSTFGSPLASLHDWQWDRPIDNFQSDSYPADDFDDWDGGLIRQTPSPAGDYPMSYSRSYRYSDDPRGANDDLLPPTRGYARMYADSDHGDPYSQARATSLSGKERRFPQEHNSNSNSWQPSYGNHKNYYYDDGQQQPLYDWQLPRGSPSRFSSSSSDSTGRWWTEGDDLHEEFWDDKDHMVPPRRRDFFCSDTSGAINSSLFSSSLQLPSILGTLWGSSPLLGSLRSIMSSTKIMMMQDQQQDVRIQLESLMEQAIKSFNSDPTCAALLGQDIRISQILSTYCSQQQSSELWSQDFQDGRQNYLHQQQRIIQLQVRVKGTRTWATALLSAVANDDEDDGDGGIVMMERIILQLDGGEEFSVPIVIGGGRGTQSRTTKPRSSTPLSASVQTTHRKTRPWDSRRSATDKESDVVDAEIVEPSYEDDENDSSRRPWTTRQRAHRRYSQYS